MRLVRSVAGYRRWDRKRNMAIRKILDLQLRNDRVEEYRKCGVGMFIV